MAKAATPKPTPKPMADEPGVDRRAKRRAFWGGAVYAGVLWGIMSGTDLWPILLIPAYLAVSTVIPFYVSLGHPLGNRAGATAGLLVYIYGLVWFVIYTIIMSAIKLRIYVARPLWLAGLTLALFFILIPLCRLAGTVGGYVPPAQDAVPDAKSAIQK